MPFGNPVDIVTEIQGQEGHIQNTFTAEHLLHVIDFTPSQDTIHQVQRELIVTGSNRGVGGKCALFLYRFELIMCKCLSFGLFRLFVQKLQSKECGMPFVHMKPLDVVISESAQYPDAANPEDYLLAKPVMTISSIEEVGDCSIPLSVFREVCIQEINRDLIARDARDFISP